MAADSAFAPSTTNNRGTPGSSPLPVRFVLKSMLPDVPLGAIFRGIAPFFVADIIRLMIVVFFPAVVLYLPNLMG